MATRHFTQRCKVVGQPRNIVIVPGHRKAQRPQLGTCGQQRLVISDLGLRRQRYELDIGNAHAFPRHHRPQLTHRLATGHNRIGRRPRHHRVQAQPHRAETAAACLAHQPGRCQFQRSQVRHAQATQ
ncbi:hypothetical protein D9M71_531900 [compost metagenome]